MTEVIIDPVKSALLLQDLQNDLLKEGRTVVPLTGAQVIDAIKA
jgi:nicotinamidase-related amidase